MSKFTKNAEVCSPGGLSEAGPDDEYVALIGDVADSRQIQDRAGFQRDLHCRLERINSAVPWDALVAPLTLTAGDEIQGLFRRPEPLVDVLRGLADDLHPVRLGWGLGWGPVFTDLSNQVGEMDGPCFHRARAALEVARKRDTWAAASGFGEPTDQTLTALFHLIHEHRAGWTDRQRAFVRAAREEIRKAVAARFGVNPSVISESLKAASFDAVLAGERALAAILAGYGAAGAAGTEP